MQGFKAAPFQQLLATSSAPRTLSRWVVAPTGHAPRHPSLLTRFPASSCTSSTPALARRIFRPCACFPTG